jgi:hypothetical protein
MVGYVPLTVTVSDHTLPFWQAPGNCFGRESLMPPAPREQPRVAEELVRAIQDPGR